MRKKTLKLTNRKILSVLLCISMMASMTQMSFAGTDVNDSDQLPDLSGIMSDSAQNADDGEYNGYIVKTKEKFSIFSLFGLGEEKERVFEEGSGVEALDYSDNTYIAETLEQALDEFSKSEIEYIEPDYIVYPYESVSSPSPDANKGHFEIMDAQYSSVYGVNGKDLDKSHSMTGTQGYEDPIVVAVIDSGLFANHSDIDYSHVMTGKNFASGAESYTGDQIGHGTFVTGEILATSDNSKGIDGLTDNVSVMPLKVFNTDSSSDSIIIEAINYATQQKLLYMSTGGRQGANICVINMSLGSSYASSAMEEAVNAAIDADIIVISAAGNDGIEAPFTASYPAQYSIGVGSVSQEGEYSLYSQRLSSTNGNGYENKVWISAPGEQYTSLYPDGAYYCGDGTSFSSPQVAALAAASVSIKNDLTDEFEEGTYDNNHNAFRELLKETSKYKNYKKADESSQNSTVSGAPGAQDIYYGWGIVSFKNMIERLSNFEENKGNPSAVSFNVKNGAGRLLDADSGLDIEVINSESGETETPDSEGHYSLKIGTEYTYTVSVPKLETKSESIIPLTDERIIDVTLDGQAYSTSFNVYDRAGTQIDSDKVSVTVTDINGSAVSQSEDFSFATKNGTYKYTIDSEGFFTESGSFTIDDTFNDYSSGNIITVTLGGTADVCSVSFEYTGTDGNPNASVKLYDKDGQEKAPYSDGQWKLQPGTYSYDVVSDYYEDISETLVIEDVDKGRNIVKTINFSKRIYPVIFDVSPANAMALQESTIKVTDKDGNVIQPVLGNTQFELTNGKYSYEISAPGYKTVSGSAKVYMLTGKGMIIHSVLEAGEGNTTDQNVISTFMMADEDADAMSTVAQSVAALANADADANAGAEDTPAATASADADATSTVAQSVAALANANADAEDTPDGRISLFETGSMSGSGTKDDPYLVATAEDLNYISDNISSLYSKYFKMTEDITVTDWVPIGTPNRTFTGTFDGDGHSVTISSIDQTCCDSYTKYYIGFIGNLQGTVMNLTVDGNLTYDTNNYPYIGGIAGYFNASYGTYTRIINCVNKADISTSGTYAYAGGIVGYMNSVYNALYNCYNEGDVTATGNGSRAGGITSWTNDGKAYYCCNNGNISGVAKTSGINNSTYGTFEDCYDLTEEFDPITQSQIDTWNESVSSWTEKATFWRLNENGKPEPLPSCEHTSSGEGVVTAPTCTEDGYTTYICDICGAPFKTDIVSSLGHDLSSVTTPATCTAAGVTLTTCSRCDYSSSEEIPAKGHSSSGEGTDMGSYYEFICDECGETYTVTKDPRLSAVNASAGVNVDFSDDGTYEWEYDESGNRLRSTNYNVSNTTSVSTMTITGSSDFELSFDYEISSETNYDKMTISLVNGSETETIANAISGTKTGTYKKSLSAGSYSLIMSYKKDGSTNKNDDRGYLSNVVISTTCEHINKTFVSSSEATCTEPAYDIYSCGDCGETVKIKTSEPLGHDFGENGLCSRCNAKTMEGFFYGMDIEISNSTTFPWRVSDEYTSILSGNYDVDGSYKNSVLTLTAGTAGTLSFKLESVRPTSDTYSFATVRNNSTECVADSNGVYAIELEAGDVLTLSYMNGYLTGSDGHYAYAKMNDISFEEYIKPCTHENQTTSYSAISSEGHTATVTCDDCGEVLSTETVSHSGENVTYTYDESEPGHHTVECKSCGYSSLQECDHNGENGACTKCGHVSEWGTETDPVRIYTEEDLKALADAVNAGDNKYGFFYKLMNDLTLSGTFTPIGTFISPEEGDHGFAGSFDGDSHTITLNITDATGSNARVGLFGSVIGSSAEDRAVIKNLTVRGTVLSDNGGHCVAGLIGYAENADISACGNMASVINNGGDRCVYAYATKDAGGLIGRSGGNVKVSECFNSGLITAYGNVGGLIADVSGSNTVLEHSYNVGQLEVTDDESISAGLICAINNKSVSVTDCYAGNTENYNGGYSVGALFGTLSQDLSVDNTYWQKSEQLNWFASASDYGITGQVYSYDAYSELMTESPESSETGTSPLNKEYYKENSSSYPLLIWQQNDGSGNVQHSHTYVSESSPETCTSAGIVTYTCSDETCGYSYQVETEKMLDHEFGSWTHNTPAEGETDIHTHTRTCTNCGYEETGECEFSWEILTPATKNEPGTRKGTCSLCGYSYEEQYESSFTGGTGTSDDPYLLTDEQDLINLANDVNGGTTYADNYFQMTDDITVTSEWPSIGRKDAFFSGTFDGDGHSVTLNVNDPEKDYTGLFGSIKNANVSKVTVLGSISGGSFTAGIAGYAEASVISYCGNEASLTGGANHTYAQNEGEDDAYTGGIVGYGSNVKIEFCFNRGNITNSADAENDSRYTSGIIGDAVSGSSVRYCYNRGMISVTDKTPSYCYTSGIAGMIWSGSVTYSYNAGTIDSEGTYTGSVIGSGNAVSTDSGSNYYEEGTAAKGIGGPEASGFTDSSFDIAPVPASDLKTDTSEVGNELKEAFSIDNSGDDAINDGYLILTWERDNSYVYQPVTQIYTEEDLWKLYNIVRAGDDYSGVTVELMNDIEMSSESLWTGIGDMSAGHMFNGVFDGNGYTIDNIMMYGYGGYIGLFNVIGKDASVLNLTVKGSASGTEATIGSIAGLNMGTISECHSYVEITTDYNSGSAFSGTFNDYIGGIAGINAGLIEKSTNNGSISLDSGANDGPCGGIAGNNEGHIVASMNYAAISGADKTGGIAGRCEYTYPLGSETRFEEICITDCGNYAPIEGYNYVGGIAGASFEIPVQITGCASASDVTSQGDYAGGIIGYMGSGDSGEDSDIFTMSNETDRTVSLSGTSSSTEVKNCYSLGNVKSLCSAYVDATTNEVIYDVGYYVGGIVGAAMISELNIDSCYSAGEVKGNDNAEEIDALVGFTSGSITNCYYPNTENAYASMPDATAVSGIFFKSTEFSELLGDGFKADTQHPVLTWESSALTEDNTVTLTFNDGDEQDLVEVHWLAESGQDIILPANPFGGNVWNRLSDGADFDQVSEYNVGTADEIFTTEEKYKVTIDVNADDTVLIDGITSGDLYKGQVTFTVSSDQSCIIYEEDSELAEDIKVINATPTEQEGTYTFTLDVNEAKNIHILLRGDVNLDGTLSVADAMLMLEKIKGHGDFSPIEKMVGDIDDRSGISIMDVDMLIKNISGVSDARITWK